MNKSEYMTKIRGLQSKAKEWDRKFRIHMNDVYRVGSKKGSMGTAVDAAQARGALDAAGSANWGLMNEAERTEALRRGPKFGESISEQNYQAMVRDAGGNPYQAEMQRLKQIAKDYGPIASRTREMAAPLGLLGKA